MIRIPQELLKAMTADGVSEITYRVVRAFNGYRVGQQFTMGARAVELAMVRLGFLEILGVTTRVGGAPDTGGGEVAAAGPRATANKGRARRGV